MGIKGLLKFLKGAERDVHIQSFRGQTVAIDGYCWLHRGAHSCLVELAMKSKKIEELPLIGFCMKRISLLRKNDVTPIVVFDGASLPMKANIEKERKERRESSLAKGIALLKQEKQMEAKQCLKGSINVTPEMALAFIKTLRKENIDVIVAPYEADAQLAYLIKINVAQLVITEDSDLLAFGCPRVFFKMDENGYGKLIEFKDIGKANKLLVGFTPDSFRHMCILSGCDYLSSISGIGPSTAVKLMRTFNKDPFRVINSLISKDCSKVPENYKEDFVKADYAFLYQLVFDPSTQAQVRLTTPLPDIDPRQLECAGLESSPSKQVQLARGNINPFTMKQMDDYSPAKQGTSSSQTKLLKSKFSTWNSFHTTSAMQQSILPVSEKAKNEFKKPKVIKKPPLPENYVSDQELALLYGGNHETSSLQINTQTVCSKYFAASEQENSSSALSLLEKPMSSGSLDSGIGDCTEESSYIDFCEEVDEADSEINEDVDDNSEMGLTSKRKLTFGNNELENDSKRTKVDMTSNDETTKTKPLRVGLSKSGAPSILSYFNFPQKKKLKH